MSISSLGNVHGGSLLRALAGRAGDTEAQGAGGAGAGGDGEATRASGRKRGAGRAEGGAAADGGAEGAGGGHQHVHGGGRGGDAKDADGAEGAGAARGARGADDADDADEADDAEGADEAEGAGGADGADEAEGAGGADGDDDGDEADGGGRAKGGGRAEGGGRAAGGGGGCDNQGEAGADDAETGAIALAQAAPAGTAVTALAAAPTTSVQAATTGLATSQATTASSLLSSAAAAVPNSEIAAQVFAAVQAGGAQVNVVSDADFAAKFGRAAGVYEPATNQISVPSSVASNPAQAGLILLHEGVHWLQHNTQGGIDALGGAVSAALQSKQAGSTAVGAKAVQQQDEAQAYLLEALAANQAGVRDEGMGTTTTGSLATYAQIQQAVRATPEYA